MSSNPSHEHTEDGPSGERSLTGHEVVDEHQASVGTVTDVLYDESGDPRWAVVDPGPLRAAHVVPVEGSYVAEDGSVVIPYPKEQVKSAAKAPRDHVLEPALERELEHHYEIDPAGVDAGDQAPSDFPPAPGATTG